MTTKKTDKKSRPRYFGTTRRRTVLDTKNVDFRVRYESKLGENGVVQMIFFDDDDETQVCLSLESFYIFFDYLQMKEKSLMPARSKQFPMNQFVPESKEKIR